MFKLQRLKTSLTPEAVRQLTPQDIDEAAASIPPYPGGYKGKGITICAGGFTYFTNAWVLLRMLRKLGCDLPIQFWFHGGGELDRRMRRLVEPYGVECIDGKEVATSAGHKISQGWPLKPLSILHSPFEEVLALDADNVPIRNPEYLFEYPEYRNTGAIFWPDVGRTEPGRAIWKLMGVPFRKEPEFESGQLLVNKALCWEPLNLAMWMNETGRAECIYKIIWGDKDTFRFAWHKFGVPFAMTSSPLQMLTVNAGRYRNATMCQHDLDGERIFQHRNMVKWELFARNPYVPGFLFEAECREFLAELRAQWNGRIGGTLSKPRGTAAKYARELMAKPWLLEARASKTESSQQKNDDSNARVPVPVGSGNLVEPERAGTGGLVYRHVDPWPAARQRGFREMRFMADGSCGSWGDRNLTFWDVQEDAKGLSLTLSNRDGIPSVRLRLRQDGSWFGRSVGENGRQILWMHPIGKIYPSAYEAQHQPEGSAKRSESVKKPAPARRERQKRLHVYNSARGIGDHVTALYACVGAAEAGLDVVFHTRFPQWLERVAHPGLTITKDLPPDNSGISEMKSAGRKNANTIIDLNHDPLLQIRHAGDKARWYADAIRSDLKPGRPAKIDNAIRIPRFDFDRYIIIAPFSAWARRDWPGTHWTRLTHLLRDAGYEVVAIGMGRDQKRFGEVFSQTTALWAIDHPADWVTDAMLGAKCIIGNDSGMVHVAGLLGVPAISLHAHLPPDFLFSHSEVTSLSPTSSCVFCRWQSDRGYNTACDAACSALATVGPEAVVRAVQQLKTAETTYQLVK